MEIKVGDKVHILQEDVQERRVVETEVEVIVITPSTLGNMIITKDSKGVVRSFRATTGSNIYGTDYGWLKEISETMPNSVLEQLE